MARITNAKMERLLKFLLRKKIPFTWKKTNERTEVWCYFGHYSNRESEFPAAELNFIKRVKDQIIEQKLYKKIPNKFKDKEDPNIMDEDKLNKIKYFHVNTFFKPGDIVAPCIEVDLKSAYWEAAYKMGLMSDALYEEGKMVSKKSRLAAIGSLAKVEYSGVFDGKKQIRKDPKRSEQTEYLWATICQKIGRLMFKSAKACGNDFLFVWVDAMFVKKPALRILRKMFKEAGFEFSIYDTQYVQFQEKHIEVKGKGGWVTEDGAKMWKDIRRFSYTVGQGMSEKEIGKTLLIKKPV